LGRGAKSTTKARQSALKKVAWPLGDTFICHLLLVNFGKLILGLYTAIFAGILLWAASFFVQLHRDLTALRAQETANQRRLAEAEARLQQQEKYLDQLRHDPALVERLIRQKLGYAREKEYIFRFEEERK
jgi:cell division protein FtsB